MHQPIKKYFGNFCQRSFVMAENNKLNILLKYYCHNKIDLIKIKRNWLKEEKPDYIATGI